MGIRPSLTHEGRYRYLDDGFRQVCSGARRVQRVSERQLSETLANP
jgi:hypothetical protein